MYRERRNVDVLELRVAADNHGEKIIEGHAAVFNQPADIGGEFYEIIERGAFDGADMKDVFLFIAHDRRNIPLARTTSGTLQLHVDNIGLAIRARLDVENNPTARMLFTAISRGDICGMSFAFNVAQDEWQDLRTQMPTRRIKKFSRIYEVSACAEPAYKGTDLHAEAEHTLTAARSKAAEQDEIQRLRQMIRERAAEPVPQKSVNARAKNSIEKVSTMKAFDFERAGAILKEKREAVNFPIENRVLTLSTPSGVPVTIGAQTISGTSVNPDSSAQVSSLVDAVAHLSLNGGDSFRQPFSLDAARGYYLSELETVPESDLTFGYSEINRAKICAYVEISEELEKLPAADYSAYIFSICRSAVRKLLAKEILFGAGEEGGNYRICGLFSERAAGLDVANDMTLSAIRDTTLDEIIYAYDGVGKDASSTPTLILSKYDLKSFSGVRTSTKAKFYDVRFSSADTGTISGVPFILSPDLPALMKADTAAGSYCAAFGNLKDYQLVSFSDLEIRRSDDFKFRQGLICFRASVHIGGNVTARNSFVRICKA